MAPIACDQYALSQSLPAKPSRTAPSGGLMPSNARLVLTNLCLLDLHLKDDWPGFDLSVFTAKTEGQKARIRCVEWVLFRLFEVWDPDETREKLQPFFPPLEPLQSLNLRAALYRCLNELKKSGVLGRDTVLRKSTLEECKGDKLVELLLPLTLAVLRKIVATQRDGEASAVAKELSMASTLSLEQQGSLLPLVIAHKFSLDSMLARKRGAHQQYAEFEALLDAKIGSLSHGQREARVADTATEHKMHQNDAVVITKEMHENWVGNAGWLNCMLYGDINRDNAYLSRSFEQIWRSLAEERQIAACALEFGLLDDLQVKVDHHQRRLLRWKTFYERIARKKPTQAAQPASAPKNRASTLNCNCRFEEHLKIQTSTMEAKDMQVNQCPRANPVYDKILANMKWELGQVSQSGQGRSPTSSSFQQSSWINRPKSPARSTTPSSRSSRKDNEGPRDNVGRTLGGLRCEKPSAPKDCGRRPAENSSDTLADAPLYRTVASHGSTINPSLDPPPLPFTLPCISPSPATPSHERAPTSETDSAAQILSSMDAPTPLSTKQPAPLRRSALTLTQRARLSVAHAIGPPLDPPSPALESFSMESPAVNIFPPALQRLPAQSKQNDTAEPQTNPCSFHRHASLLERTRHSMSLMASPPTHAAPRAKKASHAARSSLYPVNPFETPTRSLIIAPPAVDDDGDIVDGVGRRALRKGLSDDELDYERVFKSRPRVAVSPVISPEGDGGNDADVPCEKMEVDKVSIGRGHVTDGWENSP